MERQTNQESAHTRGGFSDDQMEATMGRLLQVGVLTAAAVVLTGGVMYMLAGRGHQSYRVFQPFPVTLRHPMALIRGLRSGEPNSIIDIGILLLVATPICRVIFAVVAFAMESDLLYVIVSSVVLAVLLFGMAHGAH